MGKLQKVIAERTRWVLSQKVLVEGFPKGKREAAKSAELAGMTALLTALSRRASFWTFSATSQEVWWGLGSMLQEPTRTCTGASWLLLLHSKCQASPATKVSNLDWKKYKEMKHCSVVQSLLYTWKSYLHASYESNVKTSDHVLKFQVPRLLFVF